MPVVRLQSIEGSDLTAESCKKAGWTYGGVLQAEGEGERKAEELDEISERLSAVDYMKRRTYERQSSGLRGDSLESQDIEAELGDQYETISTIQKLRGNGLFRTAAGVRNVMTSIQDTERRRARRLAEEEEDRGSRGRRMDEKESINGPVT